MISLGCAQAEMPNLKTKGRHPTFLLSITGNEIPTAVITFSAYERMSHYYTVKVTFSTDSPTAPLNRQIGKEALLTIVDNKACADGATRYFHGIISKMVHLGIQQRRHIYEVEVVPTLWRLTLKKNCRIFQDASVQHIIEQILWEGGITSDRYRFALVNEERKRSFCVQYRETDFDFISRLMEEEGIFYFFQHSEHCHTLILSDHKTVHQPISGKCTIPFNSGGICGEEDSVRSFSFSDRLASGAFTHSNFSFEKPSLDLTTRKTAGINHDLEIYDYPAPHTTQALGSELARVRMEELVVEQNQGSGESSCFRLAAGYTFSLTDHDLDAFNAEYLIISVMHSGMQPQSLEEMSDSGFSYDAGFTVIPADVQYRPKVTVSKPIIPGLQTAIVTGQPGDEIHTDEFGRIKVQFHWDRNADRKEKSSCWLRLNQPWSGAIWGIIAIPRVGDEVLVGFLEGDPDRPVVVGSVNNSDSPALYRLPENQTQMGIRTQSTPNGGRDNFHELRFEDRKGREEIYLRSERDWNILVKNNKGETVCENSSITVGGNSTTTIKGASSERADQITLTANSRITLTCGDSTIVLDPSGIRIDGVIVKVNC